MEHIVNDWGNLAIILCLEIQPFRQCIKGSGVEAHENLGALGFVSWAFDISWIKIHVKNHVQTLHVIRKLSQGTDCLGFLD